MEITNSIERPSLLASLPKVEGKQGWPWNEEVDPETYSSKAEWPKISIVTPSYNQGQFIEETIRSILLQNYPNLEYIVMDGGSKDETVAILKKYEPWITFWVSEKDAGQANAINKGFERCTGDIFNWINSDDLVAPNALHTIASLFKKGLTIAGKVYNFHDGKPHLNEYIQNSKLDLKSFLKFESHFHQPGIWCDLELFRKAGKVPENYTYYFDRIFLTKYFLYTRDVVYTEEVLTCFRFHNVSKTTNLFGHYDPELIAFYESLLLDKEFEAYHELIKKIVDYQIKPFYQIFLWQNDKKKKGALLSNIVSYLGLAVKYPKILSCRYYYTAFKQKVLKG